VEALQQELIEETLPDEARVEVEADNDEGSVDKLDELTETEQLAIERSVRPVKLALVKVSENFIDIPDSLTIHLALHSCLQIDPLDHHSASGLARDPEKGWCKCHKYAEGRCHSLELHLRYVGVRFDSLASNRPGHTTVRPWPAEI